MNKLIKETIENFFTEHNVILEGPSEKTWNKLGFSLTISTEPLKYFVLLLSNKKEFDYFIHFENETDKPFTDKEKNMLFNAVMENVKPGEIITTEGGVTPGGISAFKKLLNYGFEEIDTHKGKAVYWASPRMLDVDKFNEWIQHADTSDYIVIDKNLPLTIENTKPVVKVLKCSQK